LPWIEGVDLVSGEGRWVPYEFVHTNYTLPPMPAAGCFPASSNGLASGNTLAEAMVHALCEVIERDAAAIARHGRGEFPPDRRLDLGSIDDPTCLQLLEQYRQAQVAVGVWDLTTDVGVPVFQARIIDESISRDRPLHAATGAGCHPAREVALSRALTEAAQSRLTYIAGSRDDLTRSAYATVLDVDQLLEAHTLLTGAAGHCSFTSAPTHDSASSEEDLRHLITRVTSVGVTEVVAFDLSRVEIGVGVARVVVPGLEATSDHPSYTPGPRARAGADP
jgi:ribosomal protein S12 methylthiotransferase accessory factor